MKLMMYIGNDLIEAVALDHQQVPVPGYLGSIKRQLKEKHRGILIEAGQAADFLVVPETTDGKPAAKAG